MQELKSASGFTLVEVIVASAILMVVWLAIARILVVSAAANAGARALSEAAILAASKMEELRALPFDNPAFSPSPPDALTASVEGYSDVVEERYVRRWTIEPLPSYPDDALAIRVHVRRVTGLGEARLVCIKSRRVE